MHVLGIDIGGTGIKGAPVDVAAGTLLDERQKIATPRPATPAPAAPAARPVQHDVEDELARLKREMGG